MRSGLLFAGPAFVIFAILVAYPVVESVRLSFVDTKVLADTESFVGFENYLEALSDGQLIPVIVNTMVWTVGSLLGQMVLGLGAALLINREFRGATLVRQILLIPYVVPIVAVVLVWRWMLNGDYGIVSNALQSLSLIPPHQSPLSQVGGAMATVILINIWRGFPFAMLIYWAALRGVPAEQYEAARVDGANGRQEFFYITFPHIRNATIALLVLRGVWTLTYFDLIWLTTAGGPAQSTDIIPTFVYHAALGQFRYGYGSAIAVLTAVVLLLIGGAFILARRSSNTAARRSR